MSILCVPNSFSQLLIFVFLATVSGILLLKKMLFERSEPGIKLTPQGDTLLELAQPLVAGMDALPENFSALPKPVLQ